MSQCSQSELRISPPSSSFALSLKDLQEVLKQFTLDIIGEMRNVRRIIVPEKERIMREDGVNYKMDETTENEERLDFNMEELANTEVIQEESTILQNESVCGLEEEKLQVYSKRFFTTDPSFNLERISGEVGKEIEEFLEETFLKDLRRGKDPVLFNVVKRQDLRGNTVAGTAEELLKETSLKVLRRRKDYAFLFDVSERQVFRGDTVIGTSANYEGICRGLITASHLKDFSILKMGLPSSPYME